jgi:TonB family protein
VAAAAAAAKPAPRTKDTTPARAVAAAASSPAASAASAPPVAAPAAEIVARADVDRPAPPEPAALELVAGAESTLPEAMLQQLREAAELELEFTVTADGSVADVSVLSSNNQAVDPFALDLVRTWRFKPIAQAQMHSVQLVFRPRD